MTRTIVGLLALLAATLVAGPTHGQAEGGASVERRSADLLAQGRWHELVKFSDSAFAKGIDYFALRYRCGFARYQLQEYRQAVEQLTKAHGFNAYDPDNNALLYDACWLSGRYADAELIGADLGCRTFRPLNFVFAETGWAMSDIPDTVKNLVYHHLGIDHRLDGGFDFYHGVSFTSQRVDTFNVERWSYYLRGEVTPVFGFSVVPVLSIADVAHVGRSNRMAGLLLKGSHGTVDVQTGAYFFRVDTGSYVQLPVAVSLWPFGNEHAVFTGEYDATFKRADAGAFYKFGLRMRIGGRLWVSGEYAHVRMPQMIEADGYVLNYSQSVLNQRYQVQAVMQATTRLTLFGTLQRGEWFDGYLHRDYTTRNVFLGIKYYVSPLTRRS